jgi:hypothetical protein
MEKDIIKILLKESLSAFETVDDTITEADFLKKAREKNKKDREDKEKSGEDDEETGSGVDAVSQGEQDDLNKLSKSIYSLGIGGELSRCVFGKSDKNRALQSKLRKYMKDDPYAEKGHPDVGKTPKSIARKVIGCVTKIRAKLAKV